MINPRARPATKLWKVQLNFSQFFLQAHTAAGFEGVLNHFVHFFVLFVAEQKRTKRRRARQTGEVVKTLAKYISPLPSPLHFSLKYAKI